MPLLPGSRLGPYEIVAPIGAGGLGVVYRARDTRLDRTVAIKVLPDAVAADHDFRERFDREARVISSLEHAHICALYDVGEHEGTHFLVMQYLDGETLADRLKKGPLPLDRVIRHAIEIAGALDAAHRRGIVHRDLKPGNVMLMKAGATLLDFGLAKHTVPGLADGATGLPTRSELTAQGTILGTLQYMAPEQLEGREADARTDIFAFGAVVYEMATGRKAFEGTSQASVIAAILDRDPPPMATLQPTTPRTLDRVIRQCLAKAPDDRWQSAHDLVSEIEWVAEGAAEQAAPAAALNRSRRRDAAMVAMGLLPGAAGAALGAWLLMRAPAERVTHLAVPVDTVGMLQPPASRSPLAISPDGEHVVVSALRDGERRLYLRSLYGPDTKEIPGTQGGDSPFFSPDGQWVGFHADGALKRVAVAGGAPQTIASTPDLRGGAWGADDQIIFPATFFQGLSRVSAGGGVVETLTTLDREQKEKSHRFPQVLPGGKAVLFTIGLTDTTSFDDSRIAVLRLDTKRYSVVVQGGTYGRYVASGHLVYARGGALLAAPFDVQRLEVIGPALPVVPGVAMSSQFGTAAFDVSTAGTLAYLPSAVTERRDRMLMIDRAGKAEAIFEETTFIQAVAASPDGTRLALNVGGANDAIWVYELERKTMTRLSFRSGDARAPFWTPDGRAIVYGTTIPNGVASVAADGSGKEEMLFESENETQAGAWSPDGRTLIYQENVPGAGFDLWVLARQGGTREPFLATRFNERQPSFSPDGRWVAYTSTESGRDEVYVRPFPGPGGKWSVSTSGGSLPLWSRDGREIFYRRGSAVMAVPVRAGEAFAVGAPRLLFDGPYLAYSVLPDKQRFVVVERHKPGLPQHVNTVLNWFVELRQRIPR